MEGVPATVHAPAASMNAKAAMPTVLATLVDPVVPVSMLLPPLPVAPDWTPVSGALLARPVTRKAMPVILPDPLVLMTTFCEPAETPAMYHFETLAPVEDCGELGACVQALPPTVTPVTLLALLSMPTAT